MEEVMKMKSVMQHVFSQVPDVRIQRSKFNRSHGYKTTFNSGLLIPVFADEALPGDTYNVRMTSFCRMATPLKPIMDNLYLDTFFFAVPIRLLWDNWTKFNGEKDDIDSTTEYLVPQLQCPGPNGWEIGSLGDYLGFPTGVPGLAHSALWTRAYNLIYNEWFRANHLIDAIQVDKGDGPDDPTYYVIQRRAKRHDYFTSCQPWPQKGDAVKIPITDVLPVYGIGKETNVWTGAQPGLYESGRTETKTYTNSRGISDVAANNMFYIEEKGTTGYPNIRVELSDQTSGTINALRQAFQIQRLYENDSRGGTRYSEIIRAHFGVISPDARWRSEYLGGGSTPIMINPVVQNSATSAGGTVQGNLAGIGTASGNHGFVKSFTEHCILIGIVNVRADLTYQQGLDRMFSRRTRWDYYWPALANLGEQAVLNKEIFATNTPTDNQVFGYQERYAEYRYKPSKITGQFRSTYGTSLDSWHLSQEFAETPQLGKTFIEENPPISRVVAVQSEPEFLFDSFFDMQCVRPMPVYSIPGMVDHF
jgi:hypothetical protein